MPFLPVPKPGDLDRTHQRVGPSDSCLRRTRLGAVDDYETAFRRAKKAWEWLDNHWQRREQDTQDGLSALREMNAAIAHLARITLPDEGDIAPSPSAVPPGQVSR